MNPLVVLSAVFAVASADPSSPLLGAIAPGKVIAPGYGAVGAYGAGLGLAEVNLPAPYTTSHQAGPDAISLHQPAPQIRKEVNFGSKQFVSGYVSSLYKPPIPDVGIAVPTALKGSVSQNPAIVNTVKEDYLVNEPYAVPREVKIPVDVPVYKEQINEVAVPYTVDRPYPVPHPVAVKGEPIVNVRQGPAVVQRTHSAIAAAPVGIAATRYAGAYGHGINAAYGYGVNGVYGYGINGAYAPGQIAGFAQYAGYPTGAYALPTAAVKAVEA